MQDLQTIKLDVQDGIALVVMNNPPVNALSRQLNDELTATFDWIGDMPEIRVAVLAAEGRVFCAGADLKARAEKPMGPGDLPAHSRRTRECFHSIRECAKPVIAAVQGPALGAGLAIAASCDILYAGEAAVIGLPEIDVGLLGGGRHAMRLFGHSRTRRMMLTGWRVPAQELYRQGVVEACLPTADLLPTVMEIARTIAAKSPSATRLAKHTLNTIEDMSLRDGYRYEQDMTAAISATEDAHEARRAFAEKRPPVFKGR
ncbi:enoyl-CoA hydratase/isomerase family protein [Siccirubricoccus sp. KC 17139]|uniref:Enoyl-CoA hydratase/isomerase family protein n=1 Tax=Siccirubricoccus soli TaxID=2899147 RepID=A0ABT1D716_9PROT|nr:enoyl-CoA hydratase/isomerase family protein [Siccirubricoccus soli]MCO6417392.1 enoyl-CoA hydratase/isomerase family protein [Siccirubricoccus soli]MCP2683527.1 enoyl-CoA hydratase/isomerase family protein [Siccirubricoccus soli]